MEWFQKLETGLQNYEKIMSKILLPHIFKLSGINFIKIDRFLMVFNDFSII